MSESKIVYVNDDYDSDQDNAIIYGGASGSSETTTYPKLDQTKSEKIMFESESEVQKSEEHEVQKSEPEEPEVQKPGPEPEPKIEANDKEADKQYEEREEREDEEVSMFGGDGYRSEPDDASSVSSLDTDAILNVDPLYFRLTKFLQTGGSEPENVAEILKKINTNLELMNQNVMNLMNAKSSQ